MVGDFALGGLPQLVEGVGGDAGAVVQRHVDAQRVDEFDESAAELALIHIGVSGGGVAAAGADVAARGAPNVAGGGERDVVALDGARDVQDIGIAHELDRAVGGDDIADGEQPRAVCCRQQGADVAVGRGAEALGFAPKDEQAAADVGAEVTYINEPENEVAADAQAGAVRDLRQQDLQIAVEGGRQLPARQVIDVDVAPPADVQAAVVTGFNRLEKGGALAGIVDVDGAVAAEADELVECGGEVGFSEEVQLAVDGDGRGGDTVAVGIGVALQEGDAADMQRIAQDDVAEVGDGHPVDVGDIAPRAQGEGVHRVGREEPHQRQAVVRRAAFQQGTAAEPVGVDDQRALGAAADGAQAVAAAVDGDVPAGDVRVVGASVVVGGAGEGGAAGKRQEDVLGVHVAQVQGGGTVEVGIALGREVEDAVAAHAQGGGLAADVAFSVEDEVVAAATAHGAAADGASGGEANVAPGVHARGGEVDVARAADVDGAGGVAGDALRLDAQIAVGADGEELAAAADIAFGGLGEEVEVQLADVLAREAAGADGVDAGAVAFAAFEGGAADAALLHALHEFLLPGAVDGGAVAVPIGGAEREAQALVADVAVCAVEVHTALAGDDGAVGAGDGFAHGDDAQVVGRLPEELLGAVASADDLGQAVEGVVSLAVEQIPQGGGAATELLRDGGAGLCIVERGAAAVGGDVRGADEVALRVLVAQAAVGVALPVLAVLRFGEGAIVDHGGALLLSVGDDVLRQVADESIVLRVGEGLCGLVGVVADVEPGVFDPGKHGAAHIVGAAQRQDVFDQILTLAFLVETGETVGKGLLGFGFLLAAQITALVAVGVVALGVLLEVKCRVAREFAVVALAERIAQLVLGLVHGQGVCKRQIAEQLVEFQVGIGADAAPVVQGDGAAFAHDGTQQQLAVVGAVVDGDVFGGAGAQARGVGAEGDAALVAVEQQQVAAGGAAADVRIRK